MKILLTTRRYFQFSGLVPFECRHSAIVKKVLLNSIFIISGLSLISFFTFAINQKSFNDFLYFFYVDVATFSVFCNHVNITLQRSGIIQFIDDIEMIINDRIQISPAIERIYAKTNRKVEKLSKTATICVISLCLIFLLQTALYFFWIIFSENRSTENLQLAMPLA